MVERYTTQDAQALQKKALDQIKKTIYDICLIR